MFVISDSLSVEFSESNPNYERAISDLGLVSIESTPIKYINVFNIRGEKKGYREARFISNGPNTTVGSAAWQDIIRLDTSSRPRKVSFSDDYLKNISAFLSKKNEKKPNFYAFAVWFYRHTDLESLLQGEHATLHDSLFVSTTKAFGLSDVEKEILFDISTNFIDALEIETASWLQNFIAPPKDYLPLAPSDSKKKIYEDLKSETAGSFYPKQKIYFGPPGTGKSTSVKDETQSLFVFKTAFHPDTDYSSFVGVYKPVVLIEHGKREITYDLMLRSE